MSSRFENDSLIFVCVSSSLCIDFGTFGVGILFWIESVSDIVDNKSLLSLFLRSCFWRARIFRLCSRFRD